MGIRAKIPRISMINKDIEITKEMVSPEGTITQEMVDAFMNPTSNVSNFVTQPINAESIKEAIRLLKKEKAKKEMEGDGVRWSVTHLFGLEIKHSQHSIFNLTV